MTESGPRAGLGHLRRCLHLARALDRRGVQATFHLDGPLPPSLGFPVVPADLTLPEEIEAALARTAPVAVVADSYRLEVRTLRRFQAIARLVVLDDLAAETVPGDLIVNAGVQAASLACRGEPGARLLLGPRYALLDPAYATTAPRDVSATVRRALLAFGGAPPPGLTRRAAEVAARALPGVALDVVLGPHAVDAEQDLRRVAPGASLYRAPEGLYNLVAAADLALSAGGQTTYELAAAGVPALLVATAANQRAQVRAWVERGAAREGPGPDSPEAAGRLEELLAALAADRPARRSMAEAGRGLVDGRGAERVADEMLKMGLG